MGSNRHSTENRAGRPPLPYGTARSKRIVTFVTEGHMMEINRLVEEQGSSISAVCYNLICSSLAEKREQ